MGPKTLFYLSRPLYCSTSRKKAVANDDALHASRQPAAKEAGPGNPEDEQHFRAELFTMDCGFRV